VPNSGWAYRLLGEIYLKNGKTKLAFNSLKIAADLMPEEEKTLKLLKELKGMSQ
jgi:hypothetical protein